MSLKDYYVVHGGLLGHGAFGEVFLGVHKKSKSMVALKLVRRTRFNEQLGLRLMMEIKLHWKMSHPSILKLISFFETSMGVILVLEHCPYGDLHQLITKTSLNEPQTRLVLRQLTSGLSHLHKHNIIHRDIKLSNVLVFSKTIVKIADFGLATCTKQETKTVCGTINYLAPEIVDGQSYGSPVDIWALGCLTWSLITGKLKYDGSKTNSKLLFDLIQKMLTRDPNKRPTLLEIMKHDFLNSNLPESELPVSKKTISNQKCTRMDLFFEESQTKVLVKPLFTLQTQFGKAKILKNMIQAEYKQTKMIFLPKKQKIYLFNKLNQVEKFHTSQPGNYKEETNFLLVCWSAFKKFESKKQMFFIPGIGHCVKHGGKFTLYMVTGQVISMDPLLDGITFSFGDVKNTKIELKTHTTVPENLKKALGMLFRAVEYIYPSIF